MTEDRPSPTRVDVGQVVDPRSTPHGDLLGSLEVFLAGRVDQREDGTKFIRHRVDPRELELPSLGTDFHEMDDSRFVELECDRLPEQPWIGAYGSVSPSVVDGEAKPYVVVRRVVEYPRSHRDAWDEWVVDDFNLPQLELSAAALGHPVRPPSPHSAHSRTQADLDEAQEATNELLDSPVWTSCYGTGFGAVPGYGFIAQAMVPIVTDLMRQWLAETPYRVAIYPIVRRTKASNTEDASQ